MATGDYEIAHATASAPAPVRVTVGVHNGVGPSAATFASRIVRALEDLSRRYGPYPWSTLHMAIVPGLGSAGIEYPTMILQGVESLDFATTHEVAHQWFYSLVGSNPARHPWMDEGVTMYSNAITDDTIDFFLDQDIPSTVAGHMGEPMTFWDEHQDDYFEGIYLQAVHAFDALGPSARVDCALTRYVAANAYGIAHPVDLLDALAAEIPGARSTLRTFGIRP
jgi:hypothetical protein